MRFFTYPLLFEMLHWLLVDVGRTASRERPIFGTNASLVTAKAMTAIKLSIFFISAYSAHPFEYFSPKLVLKYVAQRKGAKFMSL